MIRSLVILCSLWLIWLIYILKLKSSKIRQQKLVNLTVEIKKEPTSTIKAHGNNHVISLRVVVVPAHLPTLFFFFFFHLVHIVACEKWISPWVHPPRILTECKGWKPEHQQVALLSWHCKLCLHGRKPVWHCVRAAVSDVGAMSLLRSGRLVNSYLFFFYLWFSSSCPPLPQIGATKVLLKVAQG